MSQPARHRPPPPEKSDRRQPADATDPDLPDEIVPDDLDRTVRAELRPLRRETADTVARHLVAAGQLLDEDPAGALAHAQAARRRASRVPAVREAAGLAAYHAGEWQTAIAELRTYQRLTGRRTHLAVLADCERGLGRPERAIELFRSVRPGELSPAGAAELLIVAAGARADLGQYERAVAMLAVPELSSEPPPPWAARLRYAYADALLAAGRGPEARDWFARAAAADPDLTTDAAERLLELDGVVLDEADPELEADPEPEPAVDLVPAPETDPDPEPEPAVDPVPEPAPDLVPAPAAEPDRLVDRYDLVILDLDGVVYVGERGVPGAVETIAQLRRSEVPLIFATNNASRTVPEVVALLDRIGVPAAPEEVLTSAEAAAVILAEWVAPGGPVLVVGAEALAVEVRGAGLQPVRRADGAEPPAAVVQGYGRQVGWAELAEASLAIQAGARWLVTNTDATLPSERGVLPGNGALVAVLRTALGREPDLVVGKPAPGLFRAAVARAGAERALVVGDRLDTDIEGAYRAGLDSLLVLTGLTDEPAARAAEAGQRPTYVGADLAVLLGPADHLMIAKTLARQDVPESSRSSGG